MDKSVTIRTVSTSTRRKGLRARRLAAGLSQEQLAKLVGCRAMTISRLERGVTNPSLQLAHAISQELGASLDELFPAPPARQVVAS